MQRLPSACCELRAWQVASLEGVSIVSDLILTNYHVLFPKNLTATRVQADFGFDVDAGGASTPVTSLSGKPSTIRGESKDDWAVVEVPDMSPSCPVLPLDGAPMPQTGDLAYILQHPGAQQKRLGFVRNMISDVEDGVDDISPTPNLGLLERQSSILRAD